jgi:hypothetical protein
MELMILEEAGGAAPGIISEKLQIKPADFERRKNFNKKD